MNKQSGFTYIEVIASLGLIGFLLCTHLALSNYSKNRMQGIQSSISNDKIVMGILDQLRVNIENYQLDYNSFDASTSFREIDINELPMAWSNQLITTKEQCPECPGRFGYTIHPLDGYKGLYVITVRITNKEIFSNKPTDFQFIVSGK